ncbi:MAG TPA: class I SAM-dependent methyltransferase [Azospirillaceae bacterium]|nr:class I SAM-dependent methyltransferase [Azospirillaceae bacterium]
MSVTITNLLQPGRYRLVDGVHMALADAGALDRRNVEAFAEKWAWTHHRPGAAEYEEMQYRRFLTFYGFPDQAALVAFLKGKSVILDAGCGYGHKANWLATLAPHAQVIAMDLSESIFIARKLYGDRPNLTFVKGDIADTGFLDGTIDFVDCDQVLHHTSDPQRTTVELARVASHGGHLALYVYARKALPRELVDEYFLSKQRPLSSEEIWDMSDRLTRLGRMLYELNVELDFPDIPQLDIRGGRQNLQRFFYDNFLKCFWNEEIGHEQSVAVNFDWYSPHIAFRFTAEEFLAMTAAAGLSPLYRYSEPACHSGLFLKPAS